jgi:hypothetical protein
MPADMTVTATSGVNPALSTTVSTSDRPVVFHDRGDNHARVSLPRQLQSHRQPRSHDPPACGTELLPTCCIVAL